MRKRQHPVAVTDQLTVHVLELPKFTKSPAELATPLDVWLYFLRHAEHLDSATLPALLATAEVRRAFEELRMLTQSELERERYESRVKMQRDISTAVNEAEARGDLMGRIQLLEQLLHREVTPKSQLRARAPEALSRLAGELEAEFVRQSAHLG